MICIEPRNTLKEFILDIETTTPEPADKQPHPRPWLKTVTALLIVLLLLLTGIYWGGCVTGFHRRGSTSAPGAVTIFYSCDTNGQMEPCRCSSGQTGGMSRRLGWLKSHKTDAQLIVDAGNVASGGTDWEQFELQYLLKGYEQAGYHAINIGHRELAMGRDGLRQFSKGKLPFVSANVFDDQGSLIFEPYRIVDLPDKKKAAVIGIVDTDYEAGKLGARLKVGSPDEALAKWLPKLKGKADMLVLLAFATEPAIKKIAEKYDQIDVIVGGNTFQPTMNEPLHFSKSTVVLITGQGKAIGHLQLEPGVGESRWSSKNQIVMLTEEMQPDKKFEAVYEDFKRALTKRDALVGDRATSHTLARSATADKYVGAESCKECHPKQYAFWLTTPHAHAFASLKAQNNHFNPRCLPCHTVGYSATDGYASPKLTPTLQNVQCEACHGRCDYHNRLSAGEKLPVKHVQLRTPDCKECHTTERSPGFDQEVAMKKIEHLENKKP